MRKIIKIVLIVVLMLPVAGHAEMEMGPEGGGGGDTYFEADGTGAKTKAGVTHVAIGTTDLGTVSSGTATFSAQTNEITAGGNHTWAFSSWPASGYEGKKTIYVTNGGAHTVTWPTEVDWVSGVAPTLTSSGLDVLVFTTIDGGTTVYGFEAGLDLQ